MIQGLRPWKYSTPSYSLVVLLECHRAESLFWFKSLPLCYIVQYIYSPPECIHKVSQQSHNASDSSDVMDAVITVMRQWTCQWWHKMRLNVPNFLFQLTNLSPPLSTAVHTAHVNHVFLVLSFAVVNCSDPGHVENGVRQSGLRYPEVFSYGVSVAIHCKRGFYLLGSALLTCLHDGRWDRPIPRCQGTDGPMQGVLKNALIWKKQWQNRFKIY